MQRIDTPDQVKSRGTIIFDISSLLALSAEIPANLKMRSPNEPESIEKGLDILPILASAGYEIKIPASVAYLYRRVTSDGHDIDKAFPESPVVRGPSVLKSFLMLVGKDNFPGVEIAHENKTDVGAELEKMQNPNYITGQGNVNPKAWDAQRLTRVRAVELGNFIGGRQKVALSNASIVALAEKAKEDGKKVVVITEHGLFQEELLAKGVNVANAGGLLHAIERNAGYTYLGIKMGCASDLYKIFQDAANEMRTGGKFELQNSVDISATDRDSRALHASMKGVDWLKARNIEDDVTKEAVPPSDRAEKFGNQHGSLAEIMARQAARTKGGKGDKLPGKS